MATPQQLRDQSRFSTYKTGNTAADPTTAFMASADKGFSDDSLVGTALDSMRYMYWRYADDQKLTEEQFNSEFGDDFAESGGTRVTYRPGMTRREAEVRFEDMFKEDFREQEVTANYRQNWNSVILGGMAGSMAADLPIELMTQFIPHPPGAITAATTAFKAGGNLVARSKRVADALRMAGNIDKANLAMMTPGRRWMVEYGRTLEAGLVEGTGSTFAQGALATNFTDDQFTVQDATVGIGGSVAFAGGFGIAKTGVVSGASALHGQFTSAFTSVKNKLAPNTARTALAQSIAGKRMAPVAPGATPPATGPGTQMLIPGVLDELGKDPEVHAALQNAKEGSPEAALLTAAQPLDLTDGGKVEIPVEMADMNAIAKEEAMMQVFSMAEGLADIADSEGFGNGGYHAREISQMANIAIAAIHDSNAPTGMFTEHANTIIQSFKEYKTNKERLMTKDAIEANLRKHKDTASKEGAEFFADLAMQRLEGKDPSVMEVISRAGIDPTADDAMRKVLVDVLSMPNERSQKIRTAVMEAMGYKSDSPELQGVISRLVTSAQEALDDSFRDSPEWLKAHIDPEGPLAKAIYTGDGSTLRGADPKFSEHWLKWAPKADEKFTAERLQKADFRTLLDDLQVLRGEGNPIRVLTDHRGLVTDYVKKTSQLYNEKLASGASEESIASTLKQEVQRVLSDKDGAEALVNQLKRHLPKGEKASRLWESHVLELRKMQQKVQGSLLRDVIELVGLNKKKEQSVPDVDLDKSEAAMNLRAKADEFRAASRLPHEIPIDKKTPTYRFAIQENNIANLMKGVFGVDVRFVDADVADKIGMYGATSRSGASTIYVRSGDYSGRDHNILTVAGHEMAHIIRKRSPELWAQIVDNMVFDAARPSMTGGKSGAYVEFKKAYLEASEIIGRQARGGRASIGGKDNMALALDEASASVFGRMLQSKHFWDSLDTETSAHVGAYTTAILRDLSSRGEDMNKLVNGDNYAAADVVRVMRQFGYDPHNEKNRYSSLHTTLADFYGIVNKQGGSDWQRLVESFNNENGMYLKRKDANIPLHDDFTLAGRGYKYTFRDKSSTPMHLGPGAQIRSIVPRNAREWYLHAHPKEGAPDIAPFVVGGLFAEYARKLALRTDGMSDVAKEMKKNIRLWRLAQSLGQSSKTLVNKIFELGPPVELRWTEKGWDVILHPNDQNPVWNEVIENTSSGKLSGSDEDILRTPAMHLDEEVPAEVYMGDLRQFTEGISNVLATLANHVDDTDKGRVFALFDKVIHNKGLDDLVSLLEEKFSRREIMATLGDETGAREVTISNMVKEALHDRMLKNMAESEALAKKVAKEAITIESGNDGLSAVHDYIDRGLDTILKEHKGVLPKRRKITESGVQEAIDSGVVSADKKATAFLKEIGGAEALESAADAAPSVPRESLKPKKTASGRKSRRKSIPVETLINLFNQGDNKLKLTADDATSVKALHKHVLDNMVTMIAESIHRRLGVDAEITRVFDDIKLEDLDNPETVGDTLAHIVNIIRADEALMGRLAVASHKEIIATNVFPNYYEIANTDGKISLRDKEGFADLAALTMQVKNRFLQLSTEADPHLDMSPAEVIRSAIEGSTALEEELKLGEKAPSVIAPSGGAIKNPKAFDLGGLSTVVKYAESFAKETESLRNAMAYYKQRVTESFNRGTLRRDYADDFYIWSNAKDDVHARDMMLQEADERINARVRQEQWTSRAIENLHEKASLGHAHLMSFLDGAPRKNVLTPGDNVEARMHGRQSMVLREIDALFNTYKLGPLWDTPETRVNFARDLAEAIKTGKSTDPRVLEFAQAMYRAGNISRMYMNRAGGNIRELPGRLFRQQHDTARIEADYAGWENFMLNNVDWTKVPAKDPKAYLQEWYTNMVNEQKTKVDPYMTDTTQKHRVLHFKEAAAGVDYDVLFGSGDPLVQWFNDVVGMADRSVFAESFGWNYRETWQAMFGSRDTGLVKTFAAFLPWGDKINHAEVTFRELIGDLNTPVNERVAEYYSAARNYTRSCTILSAGISTVADFGNVASVLRFAGDTRSTAAIVQGIWDQVNDPAARERMGVLGASITDHLREYGSMTDRKGSVFRASNKLSDLAYKLSGVNLLSEVARNVFAERMAELIVRVDPTNPKDATFLAFLGISPSEHSAMMAFAQTPAGATERVLVPDMIRNEALRSKWSAAMSQLGNMAVITPNASIRGFLTGGTKAGTHLGEAVRGLAMYKGFVLSQYSQNVRRIDNWQGGVMGREKVAWAASMLGLAFVALSTKNLLGGKEPLNPFDSEQWNFDNGTWLIMQTGVGPMAAIDSFINNAMGPMYGNAINLIDNTATGTHYQALDSAFKETPFSSHPTYRRLVREILSGIDSSYDEGFTRAMRFSESIDGQSVYLRE